MVREIRARDSTIKVLSSKLSAAAEASEAAACVAKLIDEEIKLASAEIERLSLDYEKHLESIKLKVSICHFYFT